MKTFRKTINIACIGIGVFLFTSCEDPELNALMDDYCECISESRYDEAKREECFEKMDAIKEKYKNKPQKMVKVLKKTDECY